MIRLPGGAGARRTEAIVQFHDVLPTLLHLLDMANDTGSLHGRSFLPVVRGDAEAHRDIIVTGYHQALSVGSDADFFLVRAVNCGGNGTCNCGGPGQAGDRDPEIAMSGICQ